MIKYIKSNIGTILLLIFAAVMILSPKAKALMLRQLIRIGLYEPEVNHLTPGAVSPPDQAALNPAPSVQFQTSGGETIDISKSSGKVIFVNFWATWCPPCIAEMPSINALREKYKGNDDLVFVMADMDNNLERSEGFMKKNKYDLPVYQPATMVPEQIFRGSLPTTLIVDKSGNIVFHHEGMADYSSEAMQVLLDKLLQ